MVICEVFPSCQVCLHPTNHRLTMDEGPSVSIQTFVMLDFETTGLFPDDSFNPMNNPPWPGDENRSARRRLINYLKTTNSRRTPQIVELSAVATSRNQLMHGMNRMKDLSSAHNEDGTNKTEHFDIRVPCNVHTRQIKPSLSEVEWTEYEAKRCRNSSMNLSRSALEERNDFATEWQGVKLFIEQMPKPVCIIAHNGVKFDFRVLFAELDRSDLLKETPIPDQVYFVDSYWMFMDLEKRHHEELRSFVQFVDWTEVASKASRPAKVEIGEEGEAGSSRGNMTESEREERLRGARNSRQGMSTPPRNTSNPTTPTASPSRSKRKQFDVSQDHPLQFARTAQWSPAKKKRVRPNLFQRMNDGDWVFDGHVSMRYFREKGVFKLESMYRQLINGHFDAHFAQDDCEALLQVCMAYGQEFIDYADAKAALFPYNLVYNDSRAPAPVL